MGPSGYKSAFFDKRKGFLITASNFSGETKNCKGQRVICVIYAILAISLLGIIEQLIGTIDTISTVQRKLCWFQYW
jgi:hypothetical protein